MGVGGEGWAGGGVSIILVKFELLLFYLATQRRYTLPNLFQRRDRTKTDRR